MPKELRADLEPLSVWIVSTIASRVVV
jgi:hypothetical protein